jgi:transposase-like protein
MGKNDKERRVYSKEFKAEAAALAEKKEKPISQIARDLGINENMLHRWIQQTRQAETGGLPPPRTRTAPGRGTGPAAEGSQNATGGE